MDVDGFHQLVEDIKSHLGTDAGLDSSHIDPLDLQKFMESYRSEEREWKYYAKEDLSRGYTRNLVDRGNGKSNLLVLVWTPGKSSPIHDHANAHCVMKVLKGSLKETRYAWPQQVDRPLSMIKDTSFCLNEVTYMSDTLGLHRISNSDTENIAVSLHLYTPPNASKFGCLVFDEKTGKSSHIEQCKYFSEFGGMV